MPGIAEEPLYGTEPTTETGVPQSGSIWEELIAEAGDLAIAGMQWMSGSEITNGAPTYVYSDNPEATTTTNLNWLWISLAVLAAIVLLIWAFKNRK